ncbi:hypothetical protein QTP88_017975 [Uroleucon formosanum]
MFQKLIDDGYLSRFTSDKCSRFSSGNNVIHATRPKSSSLESVVGEELSEPKRHPCHPHTTVRCVPI